MSKWWTPPEGVTTLFACDATSSVEGTNIFSLHDDLTFMSALHYNISKPTVTYLGPITGRISTEADADLVTADVIRLTPTKHSNVVFSKPIKTDDSISMILVFKGAYQSDYIRTQNYRLVTHTQRYNVGIGERQTDRYTPIRSRYSVYICTYSKSTRILRQDSNFRFDGADEMIINSTNLPISANNYAPDFSIFHALYNYGPSSPEWTTDLVAFAAYDGVLTIPEMWAMAAKIPHKFGSKGAEEVIDVAPQNVFINNKLAEDVRNEPIKFRERITYPQIHVEIAHQVLFEGVTATYTDIVTEEDAPKSAPIALYDRSTMNVVAKTASDSEGHFEIKGLDYNKEYFAVSLHPQKQYRSIVKDINVQGA